jgi:hypothetical protein
MLNWQRDSRTKSLFFESLKIRSVLFSLACGFQNVLRLVDDTKTKSLSLHPFLNLYSSPLY